MKKVLLTNGLQESDNVNLSSLDSSVQVEEIKSEELKFDPDLKIWL